MAAPQQDAIEFDPEVVGDLEDDRDSAADASSLRESTSSITSSVLEQRNIHGRTYQASKTTEYWAPTDDKHVEGIDVAHQLVFMLLGNKLFHAPIKQPPQTVLDVGTGTGIWAIDVADEYPSAEVIGTDISVVQPAWVPPNCVFEIDDAQLDWTFKKDHFDFIHFRFLYGAIDDWTKLYRQTFEHTRPGGWFEHVEFDMETRSENPNISAERSHIFTRWCDLFYAAGDKTGRTFKFGTEGQMEKLAHETGFVDIVHEQWKVPIGGWPQDPDLKRIGLYNAHFIDQSLDGFAVFPVGEILGWSIEEVTVLVSQMRAALRDPKSLPYYIIHLVYGRKPEDKTSAGDSPRSE